MEYPEVEVAGITADEVLIAARIRVAELLDIAADDVRVELAGFR
jgi:hypothetical protein